MGDGGTISSNTTANSTGGAIYAAVSPSVGSSVSIPTGGSAGNNDIYLATSVSVDITSALSSSSKILLTPNDYTVGRSVLTESNSSSYTKFTLSNTSYRISSSGKIVEIVSNLSDLNTKIANLSDGGTLEVYVTSTLSVGSEGFSVPDGKTVILIKDSSISNSLMINLPDNAKIGSVTSGTLVLDGNNISSSSSLVGPTGGDYYNITFKNAVSTGNGAAISTGTSSSPYILD